MTLPIELVVDKYHPDNSDFMQQVHRSKQLLAFHSACCRPRHVWIAKDLFKGDTHAAVAKKFDMATATVSAISRRPEVKKLMELLQHHSALWEGPTIEHRKRELWEIEQDNKIDDPRVSISAIKEMNAMDGVYKQKNDTNIEITITNHAPGALDVG